MHNIQIVEVVPLSGLENAQKRNRLIRNAFIGDSAGEPIISTLIRRFDEDASILYGSVARIKDTPFGNLTMELMEIYSKNLAKLDDIKEGSSVGIPKDTPNGRKALMVLEAASIIQKLDEILQSAEVKAFLEDNYQGACIPAFE